MLRSLYRSICVTSLLIITLQWGALPVCADVLTSGDEFRLVIPEPGDTLQGLAEQHLGSSLQASAIARFNQIDSITPGRKIVIPMRPLPPGGISSETFQSVAVLSYHRLSRDKTTRMIMRADDFRAQMQYLADNGYQVITLDQLLDFVEFKSPLPDKSVVITFDDGWKSTYEIAYPILREYGYPATLFVYTDFIGGAGSSLSWAQLQELDENQFDIQCQSKSHRNLAKLKNGESFDDYFADLIREVVDACTEIGHKLGKKVDYLAYPYGKFNALVISIMKKNGFRAGFTVKRGTTPSFVNQYLINRSMIFGNYDLARFAKNLPTSSARP